jgi:RNA polymerase sigma-70 factor (ECF subfamily)
MGRHQQIEWITGLRPRLVAFALRRGASLEEAEDAAQETLLAALEGLHAYAGTASLSTWLFGILKHKLADGLRLRWRELPLEAEADELPAPAPGPEAVVQGRSALAALERGLAALPRRMAEAFVLREVLGLGVLEVCAAMSINPSNCSVKVHRARARLRACLP